MRVGQTLAPGKRGTRRYQERYGDRLVCVRYRYDEATGKRYTTVELIEEVGNWRPYGAQDEVLVRVEYAEEKLREAVKQNGGRWEPERKLWAVRYNAVVHLGIEDRIVEAGRRAPRYRASVTRSGDR